MQFFHVGQSPWNHNFESQTNLLLGVNEKNATLIVIELYYQQFNVSKETEWEAYSEDDKKKIINKIGLNPVMN